MAILTDVDIRRLLDNGDLKIERFNEERLTPIGYNLSAGDFYLSKRLLKRINVSPGETFIVTPGETVAIRTLESIELPKNRSISGLIKSKMRMITAGFGQISTTLDSDHTGRLFIIIQNLSSYVATIEHGQSICTMVLMKNESPSKKPSNNYQDEYESTNELMNAWKTQRPSARLKRLLQATRPLLPIVFIILGGIIAFVALGKSTAFAGVMAAITAVGLLLDRFLNAYPRA